MRKFYTYQIASVAILLVTTLVSWAQTNKVSINPYTQTIRIGEPVRVDINVKSNGSESIIWPEFGDTIITQIEVINNLAPDTVFADSATKKEITAFRKQIVITSFDSGLWAFPELTVYVDSLPYSTDAFLIEVNTVEVDTSKAFKDIVHPIDLPMTWMEYIEKYYIYAVYGYAVLIVLAIIAYLIGKNARPKIEHRKEPEIPPHVRALERLDQLKSEKLWQSGAYKAYHIQISEIIREYIENRFGIPVLESTTDEIKHLLKQIRMDKDLRKEIVDALRISDLAKFAKAVPLPEENEMCMNTAYKLVERTREVEPQNPATDE